MNSLIVDSMERLQTAFELVTEAQVQAPAPAPAEAQEHSV